MNSMALIDAVLLQIPPTTSGVSGASTTLRQAWESAYHHYIAPVSREPVYMKFAGLSQTWKEERGPTSSFTDLVMHPSYQRIIGLGPAVVPSILAELAASPDHWAWALTAITGVNPVGDDIAGDLPAMSAAWLDWGSQQGHFR